MVSVILVGLGLLCLVALTAYAIYRADRDPVFQEPTVRELKSVAFDQVRGYLSSGEGWRIAKEDDESPPGSVLLERTLPRLAPPEPERMPPNAHRWTDVH